MERESSESFQRKWQVLPGRNKYLCDGRIIMSRQTGVFYFTVFLIVATMILFFAQDAPYLWNNVSPALPLVAAALLLITLGQLFKTSFSDPGVIPRAGLAEANDIEQQINNEVNQTNQNVNQYRPPPRTKEIVINGQTFRLKYCFTCKIFRPPRASHCSVCDNCILNFDHHCPWVGNCVGQRNYRHFYLFVVSLSLLCIFVFACSVAHLVLVTAAQAEQNSFLLAIKDTPGSLIVILIAFFSVWSVIGLSGFHTYLISTGQTTNEDIKGTFSRKRQPVVKNPFDRGGFFSNCMGTVCAPQAPSTIDRRGFVVSEQSVVVPHTLLLETCAPPVGVCTTNSYQHPNGNTSVHDSSSESPQQDTNSNYGSLASGELVPQHSNGHTLSSER